MPTTPCTSCPCVDYCPDPQVPGFCYCGDASSAHAVSRPPLPPKGRSLNNPRCTGFSPVVLHVQPARPALTPCSSCGEAWMLHLPLESSMPISSSSTSSASAPTASSALSNSGPSALSTTSLHSLPLSRWTPPAAPDPNQSLNHRRLNHTRPGATSSALLAQSFQTRVNVPRSHHPYPSSSRTPRNARPSHTAPSPNATVTYTYLAYVLPYGPQGTMVPDEYDSGSTDFIRIFRNRLPALLRRLETHNLSTEVTITAPPNAPIWRSFNQQLSTHFRAHDLILKSFDLYADPDDYIDSPFQFLIGGNKSDQYGQKLNVVDGPSQLLTHTQLLKIANKIKHPAQNVNILFIAPRARVDGPLPPPFPFGTHICFAQRVLDQFGTNNPTEPPQEVLCFEPCPSVPAQRPTSPTPSVSQLSSPLSPVLSRRLPPDDLSPLINDDNALPEAVMESFTRDSWSRLEPYLVSQPSTATAATASQHSHTPVSLSLSPHVPPLFIAVSPSPSPSASPPSLPSSVLFSSPIPLQPSSSHSTITRSLFSSSQHNSPASTVPLLDTFPLQSITHSTTNPSLAICSQTYQNPAQWKRSIQALQTRPDERCLFIQAPSVAAAAQALLNSLIAHHMGSSPVIPPEVEISRFSYSDLLLGKRTWVVSGAVGPGVERAVLREVTLIVSQNGACWRQLTGPHNLTWAIRNVPSTALRLATAKAHGNVQALHLHWLGLVASPFSAFIPALAIATLPSLIDNKFIRSIHPPTADKLDLWPADDVPLDLHSDSPLANIIIQYLGVEPHELVGYTSEERAAYKVSIYTSALFGVSNITHPDFDALCAGFNMPVTSGISFVETFGLSAKTLLSQMNPHRLSSPNELITHLRVNAAPDPHIPIPGLNVDPDIFLAKFARYLRGTGHPSHPNIPDDVVSPASRALAAGNPTFRAEQFLVLATGSELLPAPGDIWAINLNLVYEIPDLYAHTRPVGAPIDWEPTYPSLIFHSCAKSADVPITRALVAFIDQPDPYSDDIATAFDAAIHSTITPLAIAEGFNMI